MDISMPTDLLKQLSAASQTINQATNQFNNQVQAIEDALASYNIGVGAWVKAHEESEHDLDDFGETRGVIVTEYFLGYQKSGSRWSLMAATECQYYDPQDPRTEWVFRDAPRYVRVKTIVALPRLVEALIKEANHLAAELAEQTKQARAFTELIRPKNGQ
jgi:hypothetical protein